MLAIATSCADNCRAGGCCVQTARRVAAEHQHTLLQLTAVDKYFGAQQLSTFDGSVTA